MDMVHRWVLESVVLVVQWYMASILDSQSVSFQIVNHMGMEHKLALESVVLVVL
jgi:hypothetical protein